MSLIASNGNRYQQSIPYGWYCIAYSNELKPNEVKPLIYFGQDLVLFRTTSGEAKALDAFCPHLGAHLGHGGSVKGESIACPFHGWEFNGSGVVTAVPYAKQQPSIVNNKPCIYSYPIIEIQGLIWVWYHPERIEPLWQPDPVEELDSDEWSEVDDYNCFDLSVKSIAQEIGENIIDTAHFVTVHDTEWVPTGNIITDGVLRSRTVEVEVPDLEAPLKADKTYNLIDGKIRTRVIGPGQSVQFFNIFFRHVMMASFTPIDNETMHLRFAYVTPKKQSAQQAKIAKTTIDAAVVQIEQDVPIWENKQYVSSPMLCDNDGPITEYRQWFQQFYANLTNTVS